MFQRILAWIREALNKMLNPSSVKQALKLDVMLSAPMVEALQKWSLMYINQSSWLSSDVKSLNLAAAIASEIGFTTTTEMSFSVNGSARADFLAAQMQPVLNGLQTYTEYGAAKGGLVFKPYISGNRIIVDFIQADMFYPIAFDANGNMTACVFADQKTVGNKFYTRLESHTFMQGKYLIKNFAFQSTTRDVLGNPCSLMLVDGWADLQAEAEILNVDKPLFAYLKMPLANNIDTTSPLGVSIYARATDLIEQADRQWSDFLWEFESGKRALYTDPIAFGKGKDNKPILPDKRLYRLLELNGKIDQPGLFEDWTPTLREVNLLNGLDAILRRIEFNCGMSYGILSNPSTVALTATEIKAGKQRYYVTVTNIQKALGKALEDLLYAMDVWATLGNLAPVGTYSVTSYFDDSIVADYDTQFQQDLQVLDRVMSKVEFRMRNYGEDEETARAQLALIEPQTVNFFPASE